MSHGRVHYPPTGSPILGLLDPEWQSPSSFLFFLFLEVFARAYGCSGAGGELPGDGSALARSSGSALSRRSGGGPPPGELGDGDGALLKGAAMGELPPAAVAPSPRWSNGSPQMEQRFGFFF